MVHFTQCRSATLFYSSARCRNHSRRVTPFGYPGITGYVLLPPAFRSLSRPSSPVSSRASAMDLYSLGHMASSPYIFVAFTCIPSLYISNILGSGLTASSLLLGQTRVELVTPALSERCSNQLSYCPFCCPSAPSGKEKRFKSRQRLCTVHRYFAFLLERR